MISFKEYTLINELFNSPYKYKKFSKSEASKFSYASHVYEFYDENNNHFIVEVDIYDDGRRFVKGKELSIDFFIDGGIEGRIYKQTKSSDVFKILSTVYDILKKNIKKNITTIKISALTSESSRVKLYKKLAEKIKKEFEYAAVIEKKEGDKTIFYVYSEANPGI